MELYHKTAYNISKIITRNYSTSFYIASNLLDSKMRQAIFSIYGFVRFADEIVDTFHDYDKKNLLQKFESDLYECLKSGISLNPVLQSFQLTVKKYHISESLIDSFLKSMKYDLDHTQYGNKDEINSYIYGSADVVGLMCLKVFCEGNEQLYDQLKSPAMKLGSAFQKVNFLRDLKSDIENLGRKYFTEITENHIDDYSKKLIIQDIENDFSEALTGIRRLPKRSKLAVLIAYYYYKNLLYKLKATPAKQIMQTRVRVSDSKKLYLMAKAALVYKLKLL